MLCGIWSCKKSTSSNKSLVVVPKNPTHGNKRVVAATSDKASNMLVEIQITMVPYASAKLFMPQDFKEPQDAVDRMMPRRAIDPKEMR